MGCWYRSWCRHAPGVASRDQTKNNNASRVNVETPTRRKKFIKPSTPSSVSLLPNHTLFLPPPPPPLYRSSPASFVLNMSSVVPSTPPRMATPEPTPSKKVRRVPSPSVVACQTFVSPLIFIVICRQPLLSSLSLLIPLKPLRATSLTMRAPQIHRTPSKTPTNCKPSPLRQRRMMTLRTGESGGWENSRLKNVSRHAVSLLWIMSDLVRRHGASPGRVQTPLCPLPHSIS